MAESANDKLFQTEVLPIMDKVMANLRHKQMEEVGRHCSSLSFILAGTAGPDGGLAAQAASIDSLRYTGEWNSKHTEDYIQMVKDELKKQKITVTPEIEQKMIDKMIKDEIPSSSIEYIMKKAAASTIFYLPQALNKSPLENHISEQAEKEYNPKGWEKGTGWALGATADFLATGGMGSGWGTAVKFVGFDVALNAGMDALSKTEDDGVPMVVLPEYRKEYKPQQSATMQNTQNVQQSVEEPRKDNVAQEPRVQQSGEPQTEAVPPITQPQVQEQQEQPTNQSGWTGLLSSFGLNGISDIGNNLGYVLAMLPDMLVGALTGKTKSLGLKENMMPLASIVAGMFVRNPILKMILIGMGGMNLLNKAGHEATDNHKGQSQVALAGSTIRGNYKVYKDEELDARISQPQIKGNCLIATIDRVPCTIALPDKVVDAYNQGALPLNTLANAVLAKNDQMRQLASENYEAQQRTETRTLAQR